MTEKAKELKGNIGTFIGEWLNMYLDEENWVQKNPMVYCEEHDQEEVLEQIATFIEEHPTVEIYASGSRVW